MAKPKSGLALLLGMPSKGGRTGSSEGPDDVNDSAADDDSGDDFEQAAVDAFPELEGQAERIAAFKQAIHACIDADSDGDYGDKPGAA